MGENEIDPAAIESMKQENEELKDVLSAVQVDLEEKTEVNCYLCWFRLNCSLFICYRNAAKMVNWY